MKTIIAGSRDIKNYNEVCDAVYFSEIVPTTILSGHAKGVDLLGEKYAKEYNVPLELYPAEWDKYGKGAGFKRNAIMAKNAEALIAVWDGQSKGTEHMINMAKALKLKVFVYYVY